jgi:hypothetical protein
MKNIIIDGKKIYPSWENLFWYLDQNNIKYDFDQKYNVLNVPLILEDGEYLDKSIVNNICKFDSDLTQIEIWTYDIVISFLD